MTPLIKAGLVAFVLVSLLAAPVAADEATDAYAAGDYETALRLWQPQAERGDVAAQFNLGVLYANGQGVQQDYDEAIKWYRMAAEQGDILAHSNIEALYASGKSKLTPPAEEAKKSPKAVPPVDAAEQLKRGEMYATGQGAPQNFAEAAKSYRKAAELGDPTAQFRLGAMYASGEGVPLEYVQAYKWFTIAMARFPETAVDDQEKALAYRKLIAPRMSPAQMTMAKTLAAEWFPAATPSHH